MKTTTQCYLNPVNKPSLFSLFFFLLIKLPALSQPDQTDLLNETLSINSFSGDARQALQYISSNHNINFAYIEDDIPLSHNVLIKPQDSALKALLDIIFEGKPVVYVQVQDQVVINRSRDVNQLMKNVRRDSLMYADTVVINDYFSARMEKMSVRDYLRYVIYQSLDLQNDYLAMDTLSYDSTVHRLNDTILYRIYKIKWKKNSVKKRLPISWRGVTAEIAPVFWQQTVKDNADTTSWQYDYFNMNYALSIQTQFYVAIKSISLSLGLRYDYRSLNFTHYNFFTNIVYNLTFADPVTVKGSLHSVGIPLRVNWQSNSGKYEFTGGLAAIRKLKFTRSENNLIYRDQYFSNLNRASGQDALNLPYTLINGENATPEEIQAKSFFLTFSLEARKRVAETKTYRVMVGLAFTYAPLGIFTSSSILDTRFLSSGLNIAFIR